MGSVLRSRDGKSRLKVVVRGLPAQFTSDAFQSTVEKYLDSVDFWYFVQGKVTEKKTTNSRAYLNFKSQEQMLDFARAFDGHLFVTSKGKEQKVRVEYAPSQKVPNKAKKRGADPRDNTIATDPDYLKFVETLNEPVKSLPSAEEQLDKRLAEQKEMEANGGYLTTPLLEFLKQKRAQKLKRGGDRAERRKRAKERERVGGKEITGIAVNPNKKVVATEEKKPQVGALSERVGDPLVQQPKQERSGSSRRNRDDRRKKGGEPKGDGDVAAVTILKDKDKAKKEPIPSKPEEEGKRNKNGLWQVKKGGDGTDANDQPEPNVEHVQVQQRNPRPRGPPGGAPSNQGGRKGPPRRGGGRGEVRIYAPKQGPSPVAVRNGP